MTDGRVAIPSDLFLFRHVRHLHVPELLVKVVLDENVLLWWASKLQAVASYGYSDGSLRSTCAYKHAYTCNMHCSESKATPQSGLEKRLLPLRAHDDVV